MSQVMCRSCGLILKNSVFDVKIGCHMRNMEILLERRPWRLLYALLDHWSYGNITREKTMASLYALLDHWSYGNVTREKTLASFVCPT